MTDGPTLRWGWLATALALFSAACLSTLIVVVTFDKIDALSTVALALAVLAFSAQLIVTLAQDQQFGDLNSDTKAAVAEIRATTSSILATQKEQVNKLLEVAFRTAIPAAVEDVTSADEEEQSVDQSAELQSALQTRIKEVLKKQGIDSPGPAWLALTTPRPDVVWSSDAPPASANDPASARAQRQREWNDLLAEYPSRTEGEPVVEIMRQLPPRAISTLGRVVGDATTSLREDRSVNYRRRGDQIGATNKRLIDAGLLEKVSEVTNPDGATVDRYKLTPTGIIAARILRGRGKPPEWAADMA